MCSGGKCQPVVLASGQNHPFAIAIDRNNVYWANQGDGIAQGNGGIMKVPLTGAPSPTPLATMQVRPTGIAVDATHVYWAVNSDTLGAANSGEVRKIPIGGGAIVPLASSQDSPGPLAADGSYIYWWVYTGPGPLGRIKKVLKTGGSLLDGPGGFPSPNSLVMDLSNFYFGVNYQGTSTVYICSMSVVSCTTVHANSAPMGVAVDNANVYWTEQGGVVRKTDFGGSSITDLAPNQASPLGIVVDGTGVYWTNVGDETIAKTSVTGGMPVTLAQAQEQPNAIAVDEAAVYWVNNVANGSVMKVAK
jgi:hypothetical protein